MSKGTVNKVIIIGNLGADPEVRSTANGGYVASLRLATTEAWKDRNTGENQERTEWHRVSIFGRTAEVAQQYLRKGAKVYIEGRLQTRKWQDQNGQDRYSTDIVGDVMQMLDSRGGGMGAGSGGPDGDVPFNRSTSVAPASDARANAEPQTRHYDNSAGLDDDVPF